MSEKSEYILSLNEVTKIFDHDIFKKKETAVDGFSTNLRRGRCTGLLGHNGAGKTTTLKMILGLIKPSKGSIQFAGFPFRRRDLKNIGYMPEINKLSPLLTCYETLDFQLGLYGVKTSGSKKDLINATLDKVGLKDHKKKKVEKLSKGQGRRLGFAYATIHEPELLILDEPFSGMDPIGRDFMVQAIESLRSKGASILLCTHELEAARRLCDDIVILREGKKVYDSVADEQVDVAEDDSINYSLIVSGVSTDIINEMIAKNKLEAPTSHEVKDFLHEFVIGGFENAAQWLKACSENSLTVIEFKEQRHTFGENEDLLKYLKRDNV